MRRWRGVGRFIVEGIGFVGAMANPAGRPPETSGAEPARALLREPPERHPERLVPGVPLTPDEESLWSQLATWRWPEAT
jgi:hypothetical protein